MSLPTGPKKRVLIVDDHAVFRAGLRKLLERQSPFAVCGEAANEDETLSAVERYKPDIVLMDLTLGDGSGIDLTRKLRAQYPAMPVLIVSMHKEAIYAGQALRAGASGYVMKEDKPQRLIEGITQVLAGQIHVSPAIMSDLLQKLPGVDSDGTVSPIRSLSDREMQVFRMIGEGKGTRQIAQILGLSVKTIESYRAHIKEKMGYETSYQLVRAAICWSQNEKRI